MSDNCSLKDSMYLIFNIFNESKDKDYFTTTYTCSSRNTRFFHQMLILKNCGNSKTFSYIFGNVI